MRSLLPLVALIGLLAGCGTPPPAKEPTGALALTITGVPAAPVTVRRADTDVFSGTVTGATTLTDLVPGAYSVTPGPVDGHTAPAPRTVTVQTDTQRTELVYVQAAQATTTTLTVTVTGTPSAPITVLDGSDVLVQETVSGRRTFTDLPRHTVTVQAGNVPGRSTPEPVTVDLSSAPGTLDVTYGDPSIPADHLRGRLEPWSGLSGASVATSFGTVWVNAGVAADGTVDLTLPQPGPTFTTSPLDALYSGCTPALTVSDPALQVTLDSFGYVVFAAAFGPIGSVTERPVGARTTGVGSEVVRRMYADRAATVTGTVRCGSWTVRMTLRLTPGWNVVRDTITAVDASGSVIGQALVTAPAVTATTLAYTPTPARFSAALDTTSFTLNPGGSQTLTLTLDYINGFHGLVTLGLNPPLPGVSVSPATITVPDVTAQRGTGPASPPLVRALASPTGRVTVPITVTAAPDAANGSWSTAFRLTGDGTGDSVPLNVAVIRPTFDVFLADDTVTAAPGEPTTLRYFLESRTGYHSVVGVTLAGAPAGVTYTDSGADLTVAGSASGQGTLTVAPGTPPGTYATRVVATGGGVTIERPLQLVIPAPTYELSANLPRVYQAEPMTFSATVVSRRGFAGVTSLSLDGLPAGVTLATVPNVSTGPGEEAAVNLTLTATPTAPTGDVPVTLVGQSGVTTVRLPLTLSVQPRRYATGTIDAAPDVTVDAQGHPWFWTADPYASTFALGTLDASGQPVHLDVRTSNFGSAYLLTGLDGQPWFVLDNVLGTARWDTRSVQTWRMPASPNGVAIDAQGRAWMGVSSGGVTTLHRYDPATGVLTAVDQTGNYDSAWGALRLAPGGLLTTTTHVAGARQVVAVDTTTGRVNRYAVPAFVNPTETYPGLEGRIWVYGTTGSGPRLGLYTPSTGTMVLYEVPENYAYGATLTASAAGTPCLLNYIRMACFNATTRTWTARIFTSSTTYGGAVTAPAPGGGWWYSWAERSQGYLTFLTP